MKSFLKKYSKLIIISIIAIALIAFLCLILYKPFLSIVSNPQGFRERIESWGLMGYGVMVLIIIVQMILAFLPGEPVEFAAGFCFGPYGGTIICLVANFIGATMIFLLVRYFNEKIIYKFFDEKQVASLAFLKNETRIELILFLVFFIPGTPKDLLTYFAPLTMIKPLRFVVLTTVARIPSIISSTIAGSSVLNSNYSVVIWIYLITAVLAVFGIFAYNRYIAKHKHD